MAGNTSCLSDEALNRCRDLGRRISEQHRKRRFPWQPSLECDWLPSVLEKKLKDESGQSSAFVQPQQEKDLPVSAALQTSSVHHSNERTPTKLELEGLSQGEGDDEGQNFTTDDLVSDGDAAKNFFEVDKKLDTVEEKKTLKEESFLSNIPIPPAPEIQEVEGEVQLAIPEETLSKEFSDVLTEMHQRWSQGEQVEFAAEHHFFTSCSPQQMESACVQLDKLGLSEVAMCTACHFMAQVTPPPSHTNCCVFIRQCLLPLLHEESGAGSRVLSAAVVEFARKYLRPFVETAVVPLLTTMEEGSWLWDVLHRLVTEADTQRQDLVSILQVLYGAETWSESTVALLQTVLNQKPSLDSTSLSDLTTAILSHAVTLNSNLKFTKLILAVINTYGKMMSQDDVKKVTTSLECNQTFLKRAALAALKRVTK